jgi:hypothetical protein
MFMLITENHSAYSSWICAKGVQSQRGIVLENSDFDVSHERCYDVQGREHRTLVKHLLGDVSIMYIDWNRLGMGRARVRKR